MASQVDDLMTHSLDRVKASLAWISVDQWPEVHTMLCICDVGDTSLAHTAFVACHPPISPPISPVTLHQWCIIGRGDGDTRRSILHRGAAHGRGGPRHGLCSGHQGLVVPTSDPYKCASVLLA